VFFHKRGTFRQPFIHIYVRYMTWLRCLDGKPWSRHVDGSCYEHWRLLVFWRCKSLYIYHIIILSCYHITIWSYGHSYHNIIWEKYTCSGQTSGSVLCVYIYILIVLLYYYTDLFYNCTLLILILLYFYTITLSCYLMLSYYFAIMLVVLLYCFTIMLFYCFTIVLPYYNYYLCLLLLY